MLAQDSPATYWSLISESIFWCLALSPLQLAFHWIMNHHIKLIPDLLKITGAQTLVFFLGFVLGGLPFFPHPLPIPRALLAFFLSLLFFTKRYDGLMDRGSIIGTSALLPIVYMAIDFGINA